VLRGDDLHRLPVDVHRRPGRERGVAVEAAEITNIAEVSGLSLYDTIARLRDAGLDSIPGGGAEILDDAVKGEEPLRLTSRFESAHLPFSLASRLMRDFRAIVGVSFCAVGDFAQNPSQGGRVAS